MNEGFVKLKDLVGSTFEVLEVNGYTWKKWDDQEKKMLTSDLYEEGYRKLYAVKSNKGKLDLGSGQLGSLLEAVFSNGKADLINQTFEVKSNGKAGMDIRYYFNVLKSTPKIEPLAPDNTLDLPEQDAINLEEIPF